MDMVVWLKYRCFIAFVVYTPIADFLLPALSTYCGAMYKDSHVCEESLLERDEGSRMGERWLDDLTRCSAL